MVGVVPQPALLTLRINSAGMCYVNSELGVIPPRVNVDPNEPMVENTHEDVIGRYGPVTVSGVYAACAREIGSIESWTDLGCLYSEVYGGMGTQFARCPGDTVGDAYARFCGDHSEAGALIYTQAGGWDTLRRTLNRIRPLAEREAVEVWGVKPLSGTIVTG